PSLGVAKDSCLWPAGIALNLGQKSRTCRMRCLTASCLACRKRRSCNACRMHLSLYLVKNYSVTTILHGRLPHCHSPSGWVSFEVLPDIRRHSPKALVGDNEL